MLKMIYLKEGEIKSSLGSLVKYYVQECVETQEIPQQLVELIKHNFFAKYVTYNKLEKTIEIGINESKHRSLTYPHIKVYSFPLEKTSEWIDSSFKTGRGDLEFYGQLINMPHSLGKPEIVVV